jgi:hypothetical protein
MKSWTFAGTPSYAKPSALQQRAGQNIALSIRQPAAQGAARRPQLAHLRLACF